MAADLLNIIQRVWGYDSFRPLQERAVKCVLEGRDSVVVLPTGGGKSLCFQAPAVAMEGLAIVVSPLIALMKDQVDALRQCGVAAAALNSATPGDERWRIIDGIESGELKLLYAAPERLVQPDFLRMLGKSKISFVAVDEAHCISHWGHDFRPEYRQLSVLKSAFPGVNVHGYTASANAHVREDIARELKLDAPQFIADSFDRPNLIFHATSSTFLPDQVSEVIERHRGESGIVYCISRKKTEELAAALVAKGYKALPYHAGMDDGARKANQEAFIREKADVMVATIAFGMGIDKSNVRYVVHAGMPKSVEHYHQESGRAGRDGLEAECRVFYSSRDLMIWRRIIENSEPEQAKIALAKLDAMYDYCRGVVCRHRALLAYFGEQFEKANCGACDVCLQTLEEVAEPLVLAQKILSCIVRIEERFGGDYAASVLIGADDARIQEHGHEGLSTFGLLREHDKRQVREWIEQLVGQGFLKREGEFHTLGVTKHGWDVIRGKTKPRLLRPAARPARTAKVIERSWEGVDAALFEELRLLRLRIADEAGVPAFVVFDDATLREMARIRPTTREAFLLVRGVGEKKAEAYADRFTRTIADYCETVGLETNVMETAKQPVNGTRAKPAPKPVAKHADLFRKGLPLDEIALSLMLKRGTISRYLCDCIEVGEIMDIKTWVDDATLARIRGAIDICGAERLKPIFDHLNGEIDYERIRIAVTYLAKVGQTNRKPVEDLSFNS